MTNQQHPITPPPELVQKWVDEFAPRGMQALATQAANWGADVELEACVELLACRYGEESHVMNLLRAVRRPKPPSLKEQALAELEVLSDYAHGLGCSESAIRRALESLPS